MQDTDASTSSEEDANDEDYGEGGMMSRREHVQHAFCIPDIEPYKSVFAYFPNFLTF